MSSSHCTGSPDCLCPLFHSRRQLGKVSIVKRYDPDVNLRNYKLTWKQLRTNRRRRDARIVEELSWLAMKSDITELEENGKITAAENLIIASEKEETILTPLSSPLLVPFSTNLVHASYVVVGTGTRESVKGAEIIDNSAVLTGMDENDLLSQLTTTESENGIDTVTMLNDPIPGLPLKKYDQDQTDVELIQARRHPTPDTIRGVTVNVIKQETCYQNHKHNMLKKMGVLSDSDSDDDAATEIVIYGSDEEDQMWCPKKAPRMSLVLEPPAIHIRSHNNELNPNDNAARSQSSQGLHEVGFQNETESVKLNHHTKKNEKQTNWEAEVGCTSLTHLLADKAKAFCEISQLIDEVKNQQCMLFSTLTAPQNQDALGFL